MERKIKWSLEFSRRLERLSRKSHKIDLDVESFQREFDGRRLPGDQVSGIGGLPVKEHRMRDSSSNIGKRGGFRVYYYYEDDLVLFLLIVRRNQLHTMSSQLLQAILRSEGFLDV